MTARGRFGPWLLVSLALHAAVLAGVLLALAPPAPEEPRPPPGVEVVWDQDAAETVGGGDAGPPTPEPPAEPPPPPAEATPPPALVAPPMVAAVPPAPPAETGEVAPSAEPPPPPRDPAPAETVEVPPDLPLPPPPAPPAPPRRAAAPREEVAAAAPPGPLPGPLAGLGRALGAVSPPAPDERFRNAGPPYPDAARRRGEQGQVLLELAIGTDGRVIAVQVVRSSGSPILDDAARRAALDWRFRPAQQDGQPVPATARTTVQFRLE